MRPSELTIGFIPLSDAAPLILAKDQGFFDELGLDVHLSKEHSWAQIRDKLAVGDLDAAHMLSPMVLESALQLSPIRQPFVTALAFNLNGNGVTVSNALFEDMMVAQPEAMAHHPRSADALAQVVQQRRESGQAPITLAMVYPFSTHNYLLRYWLAASGLEPDKDLRLIVVPPADMADLCAAGKIDGFCVGEPWNTVAADRGVGVPVVSGQDIWAAAPEKVLGVRASWAVAHAYEHERLIAAHLKAIRLLTTEEGLRRAAYVMAAPEYLGLDETLIHLSLSAASPGGYASLFDPAAGSFPWKSKALWLGHQMLRWGQFGNAARLDAAVNASYRTDLFRQVAEQEGIILPPADKRVEGCETEQWSWSTPLGTLSMPADHFIDGAQFDPGSSDQQ